MSLAGIEPGWGENTPQHKPLRLNLIDNFLSLYIYIYIYSKENLARKCLVTSLHSVDGTWYKPVTIGNNAQTGSDNE